MKRDEQAGRMILEASTGLHGYVAKDIARAWCELAQRAQELQSRLESLEKDAARWKMIPAVAYDHQINLMALYRDIETAMQSENEGL